MSEARCKILKTKGDVRKDDSLFLKWYKENRVKISKAFIGNAIGVWSRELLGLSMSRIRAAAEILTGHNNLNKHRHTMGKHSSPECDGCQEGWKDFQHSLCECVGLARERHA